MNIFKDYSGFHGEIKIENLNKDLQNFFELSKEIRNELGSKAYLFDEYVLSVLKGINAVNASCAIDDCFDATGKWNKLIYEYVAEQPPEFQEQSTINDFRVIETANDYFAQAVEWHKNKCRDRMVHEMDIINVRRLYDEICRRLGREELMERLNFAIRQRFLIANSEAVFMQGLSENLLHSLINRDIETNNSIFTLVLNKL